MFRLRVRRAAVIVITGSIVFLFTGAAERRLALPKALPLPARPIGTAAALPSASDQNSNRSEFVGGAFTAALALRYGRKFVCA